MVEANAEYIELFRDASSYNSAFNHNASDKMKLLGLGDLPAPAQCFVCGSGACEAGYITFGVWVDFVGNLLICTPCLVQAGETIGCLAPVIHQTMLEHIKSLQDYSKGLEIQLVSQDEQLSAYDSVIRRMSTDYSGFDSEHLVQPPSDDKDDGESDSVRGEPESDDVESSNESGRENVPDPTAVNKDALVKFGDL